MATTTNFSWETPDDTDLVKDGAAAIRTLGNSIDTSFVDLKGGTTGQVLAKASNTDLDYTWTSPNPGDITAVTAGTGITGGGTSGDVTVSFDQANYGGGQYAAGKNKIINGDFGIWQRGTSFTTSQAFTADRWQMIIGTGAATVSQQAFTAGTAPVAGYESDYFIRYASANASDARILQNIENVRTFAGQTITVSFFAKSATSDALSNIFLSQNFGTGGSTAVITTSSSFTLTSSWARYTATLNIPSIAGKTIGANNNLRLTFNMKDNATFDCDIWGVQVENGSVATPFQTATGTVQGELAACQRYYYRLNLTTGKNFGSGMTNTTDGSLILNFPVTMRTSPTSLEQSGTAGDYSLLTAISTVTVANAVPTYQTATDIAARITITTAGGLTNNSAAIGRSASGNAYLGWSAEL